MLVAKSLELLDTDQAEVGWPMVDFLAPWVQTRQKMQEVQPEDLQVMATMLEAVIKRYAFPSWCEVEVEPDDSQAEYSKQREMLKVLYLNLARVNSFWPHLLKRVEQEVDTVQA